MKPYSLWGSLEHHSLNIWFLLSKEKRVRPLLTRSVPLFSIVMELRCKTALYMTTQLSFTGRGAQWWIHQCFYYFRSSQIFMSNFPPHELYLPSCSQNAMSSFFNKLALKIFSRFLAQIRDVYIIKAVNLNIFFKKPVDIQ